MACRAEVLNALHPGPQIRFRQGRTERRLLLQDAGSSDLALRPTPCSSNCAQLTSSRFSRSAAGQGRASTPSPPHKLPPQSTSVLSSVLPSCPTCRPARWCRFRLSPIATFLRCEARDSANCGMKSTPPQMSQPNVYLCSSEIWVRIGNPAPLSRCAVVARQTTRRPRVFRPRMSSSAPCRPVVRSLPR
jgi:hypothetical protein